MYQAERAEQQQPVAELVRNPPRVSRNVWLLGLTSLFTDVSSEMVSSVLPAYLVLHLGMSPMVFGAVDGLYQGVGSVVRWVAGLAADRWSRHKEIAALGYAASALCRLLLLLVGTSWTAIAAVITADRVGKGVRTAPRDALISLSSARDALGAAFGLHRAFDAGGALVGPFVAFAVLAASARAFDLLFVISFSVALVGVAVIALLVENVRRPDEPNQRPGIARLVFEPVHDGRFRRIMLMGAMLAMVTTSDGFIYLVLQQRSGFGASTIPLLAAATAVCYMAAAVPAGRLADRFGRVSIFLAGHVLLLLVYGVLMTPIAGGWTPGVAVLLLGGYYAATDGVLAAAGSALLSPQVRASGLALLGTAVSLGRLAASVVFGWAWTRFGSGSAVAAFAAALAAALILAAVSRKHLEATAR